MENIEWNGVVEWLMSLKPWVEYVFIGLGTLVVVGSGIDKIVPDEYDKGFMSYVFKVPVLGSLLKFVTKFSPFNVKE